jgi:hypothetical protein
VGHATLSRTSHQLKNYIVERLVQIASDPKDARNLAAAWELSICYFSGFGVEPCFEKCSHWLTVASRGGIIAAQRYFETLHLSMGLPCPAASTGFLAESQQFPLIEEAQPAVEAEFADKETLQGSDDGFVSDSEGSEAEHHTRVVCVRVMPRELAEIVSEGTCEQLCQYLEQNPEYLNSQDADGETPLVRAARHQQLDMLRLLGDKLGSDASINTRAGRTVLHFLSSFDETSVRELVPPLVRCGADLYHEALPVPSATDGTIFSSGIQCCPILNAILHGNLALLESLLEVAHNDESIPCKMCEAGSRFRRTIAISLSIFQAKATKMLVDHVKSHGNGKDIGLKKIRVWAGQDLLPLHKVPFKSVAIGALDLPESFFRAINYGSEYNEAMHQTIDFLLSMEDTAEKVKKLAYTMLIAAVNSNSVDAVRILLDQGRQREFPRRWWLQGPLDDSPFMLSIRHGHREVFRLFLKDEPAILKNHIELACWRKLCIHRPAMYKRYLAMLLGQNKLEVEERERKHKINPAQRAIWLFINSDHQDTFFL